MKKGSEEEPVRRRVLLGFQPTLLGGEDFHDNVIPAFSARALEMLVVGLPEHEHVLA